MVLSKHFTKGVRDDFYVRARTSCQVPNEATYPPRYNTITINIKQYNNGLDFITVIFPPVFPFFCFLFCFFHRPDILRAAARATYQIIYVNNPRLKRAYVSFVCLFFFISLCACGSVFACSALCGFVCFCVRVCTCVERYLLRNPGRDFDLDRQGTEQVSVLSAAGAKHELRCDSTPVRRSHHLFLIRMVGRFGWLTDFSCFFCELVFIVGYFVRLFIFL